MSGPHLACDYAGVTAAGEVAERQVRHLGDVAAYVGDVCGRTDAFRGVIAPFAAPYAEALLSVADGLTGGREAAGRWGAAARDAADDLARTDRLARRLLERVQDLLPGWVPDLADTVAPVAPVAPGVPVPAGAAPPPPPCPALPDAGESAVPVADAAGAIPDLPGILGDGLGLPGTFLGQGWTLAKDRGDLVDAAGGIGDDLDDAEATADDLDRYAAFAEGAA